MNELIYEVDGNMGRILMVFEDKLVISSKADVRSALFGGLLSGNKEFYFTDITSVQFKNLGMTTGYLQFEYPGSQSGNNFHSIHFTNIPLHKEIFYLKCTLIFLMIMLLLFSVIMVVGKQHF